MLVVIYKLNNNLKRVNKMKTIEEVVNLALAEASMATDKYLVANPDSWYPCGFASVKIKPARGKLVSYLKAHGIGSVSYSGGYQIWNPSGSYTQSMNAKVQGADAFVKVLADNGFNAYTEYRLD